VRLHSRREFLRAAGIGSAALLAPRLTSVADAQPERPNIIFILADDLGWMDTSVYGSEYYETPNIDRLAQRGMLFTDAYAASPLCSPTRASILTGKHPARLRITTPACHLDPLPPDRPLLPERGNPEHKVVCPLSRRYLRLEEHTIGEALRDEGYETAFIGKWHLGKQAEHWPREQGFDFDLGAPNPGPPSYFSPYRFPTIEDGPEDEYITDRITDDAVAYITRMAHKPFFLCLWQFAVHAPFQAKEEITERYRDKEDPRGEQDCPIMASMIQSMDESIGRVLDTLEELQIADNTIIVFMSDNGGNMYNEVEGTTPTNNAPLRNGKGSIYEGGVREPCVIVWPGVVEPGSRCSEIISSVDFYPTLLEMAGNQPKAGPVLDGESIVPLLTGTGTLRREAIFCHFPHYIPATGNLPSTSVRKGDWKLIRLYGEGPDRSDSHELYNLVDDIGETTNRADEMPDMVRELDALIDGFLADTEALVPFKNPAYAPPVAGWLPSGQCTLSVAAGAMRVESTGGDPFLRTSQVPAESGEMVIRMRMRSSSEGGGQFFWATKSAQAFSKANRLDFQPVHDGEWHEYEVAFTAANALTGIRIDPCATPGLVELDWVRLHKADDTVLREWDFE